MTAKDYTGLGNLMINKDEGQAHHLDLFSPVTVETGMRSSNEVLINVFSSAGNEGPFEFYIPGTNDYLSLPQIRLNMQLRITNNGNPFVAADQYSVVNLFPQTLFKQVDIEVNGVNLSHQDGLYPFKSYFETLFSYKGKGPGHLRACSHFYMDTPNHFDDQVNNDGWVDRRVLVANSRVVDFTIPLSCDILQSARLLPPNIPVKITLTRNNDAFSVLTNDNTLNPRIEIKKLALFVTRIDASGAVRRDHEAKIPKELAFLPFTRSILKKRNIAAEYTNEHISNIFSGLVPRQVVMGFVGQTRLNGAKNLNPFRFQHFNVSYVGLKINGVNYPAAPFTPDFENGLISRELRFLYDNIGTQIADSGPDITREMFQDGYTLFAWDITPDRCNGWHHHEFMPGEVSVDLRFSEPLPVPINVLFYGSFETQLSIKKDLTVVPSFQF
jgi:hypothetical protein